MVGGQDNLSSKRVCLNERKGYEGIPNEPGTRFENVVTSRRDMFIACPVAPGRPANRDPIVGSWFIQSIIEVFAAKACNTHLDELMKSVKLLFFCFC